MYPEHFLSILWEFDADYVLGQNQLKRIFYNGF